MAKKERGGPGWEPPRLPDPAEVATRADVSRAEQSLLRGRETVRSLEAETGVSKSTLHALRQGKRPMTKRVFLQLVRAYYPELVESWKAAWDRVGQPRPKPDDLPPAVRVFVGRDQLMADLDECVSKNDGAGPMIVLVTGPPGVGKTELVLQWAHQVSPRFDRAVYLDLHGFSADSPIDPETALLALLNRLGRQPSQSSQRETVMSMTSLDDLAAAYRIATGGRRLLIVLDNAYDVTQVRPLLPGSRESVVVVTSRSSLTGLVALHDAYPIELDVLSQDHAVSLLTALLGMSHDDPVVWANELADLCGRLPLALRVAAASAGRSTPEIARYVRHLRNEQERLDNLQADGDPRGAIRLVLSWSYEQLTGAAARAFELLGLPLVESLDSSAAAALLAAPSHDARAQLQTLASAHLLVKDDADHVVLHGLVRLYARERAKQRLDEVEQQAASDRLLLWYAHAVDRATGALTPQRRRLELPPAPAGWEFPVITGHGSALSWLDSERINLVSACRQAAAGVHGPLSWQLPALLGIYFYIRKGWSDWISTHTAALTITEELQDDEGRARVATSLGNAYYDLADFAAAAELHELAATLRGRLSDQHGVAVSLLNLGEAQRGLGHYDDAARSLQRALEVFHTVEDAYGKAMALSNLAGVYREAGDLEQALEYMNEAQSARQRLSPPDPHGLAFTLITIGDIHRALGDALAAVVALTEARAVSGQFGDRHNEAEATCGLAELAFEAGDRAEARHLLEAACNLISDENRDADPLTRRLTELTDALRSDDLD